MIKNIKEIDFFCPQLKKTSPFYIKIDNYLTISCNFWRNSSSLLFKSNNGM